jgi:hypothetical protein
MYIPWISCLKKLELNNATSTFVLTSGENASISYLVEPFLRQRSAQIYTVDTNLTEARSLDWSKCKCAVIVRYAPNWLLSALRRFHEAGGHIVYFMDDDLMDPAALKSLPPKYRRKILDLATRQRHKIAAICDEYWVSTPYLANKYADWSPVQLSPSPAIAQLRQVRKIEVCYHGTSSHQAEIEWLAGIVKLVQKSTEAAKFELFGDHTTNRLFRTLPRVSVVHPMTWCNYLEYTASVARDIGLAPLLPNPFNAARGPTKFFDFARMGAVGLYSDVAPYKGFIRDGVDGLLLPNEPEVWCKTIIDLAGDAKKRTGMAIEARERALAMAESVTPLVTIADQKNV